MRLCHTLPALLSGIATLFAQQQFAPYDDPRNLPYSPEVHADRTITFRLYAPQAHDVLLVGPTIVAALKGTKALTKDEKGVWSLTVGPLDPAVYSYGFSLDGAVRIPDPANPNVEERRWGHTSYIEVPGDPHTPRDYRPVPHGTLHTHAYDSKSLNAARQFVVYTPPGYELSKAKYPVLYLLHGATQTEESWSRVGGAQVILDNLLSDGKAKPMVIVMPYGHVARQMIPAPAAQGRGRGGPGGAGPGGEAAEFERDLLSEVIPVVEKIYRLLPGTANRAILALSMGGGEAMQTGLHHPELFGYIGAFSGVTNYRADLERIDHATLNRYRLIWLGCGTDDSLYASNKAIADWMDTNKIRHTFISIPGAHVWPVWHRFLAETAPQLFNGAGAGNQGRIL
jgi:enterochelin esterase-like enzyme